MLSQPQEAERFWGGKTKGEQIKLLLYGGLREGQAHRERERERERERASERERVHVCVCVSETEREIGENRREGRKQK